VGHFTWVFARDLRPNVAAIAPYTVLRETLNGSEQSPRIALILNKRVNIEGKEMRTEDRKAEEGESNTKRIDVKTCSP
jgi:hypothetical protein